GEFRTAEVSGTPDFASFNAGAYFPCPHVVSTPGVLSLALSENTVHEVLRLPDDFRFPAIISANLLRYDPIGWTPLEMPSSRASSFSSPRGDSNPVHRSPSTSVDSEATVTNSLSSLQHSSQIAPSSV
ncbi:unnamed protein product, partial [Protopolystoma xenopodis]